MSTSQRKKLQRQEEHKKQKEKKRLEALFATKKTKKEFKEYVPSRPFHRDVKEYASLTTKGAIQTPKREPQQYTGTLIRGIATMHKSNAVPVISDEHAIEISRMRRG